LEDAKHKHLILKLLACKAGKGRENGRENGREIGREMDGEKARKQQSGVLAVMIWKSSQHKRVMLIHKEQRACRRM
jgi:hypothetical protein